MTPTNVWQKAFLGGQSTRAVDALHSAWQDLVTFSPETFCSTAKEPVLTEILCEQLAANRASDRLTGMWSYEVRQGRLVRSGKRAAVVDRKRTDIRYFTDSESPALDLIFEFKRIDHRASRRKYYTGEEGIMRFVTGDYSVGQPVALMVGILTVHHDDCVPRWRNGSIHPMPRPSCRSNLLEVFMRVGRRCSLPPRSTPSTAEFPPKRLLTAPSWLRTCFSDSRLFPDESSASVHRSLTPGLGIVKWRRARIPAADCLQQELINYGQL